MGNYQPSSVIGYIHSRHAEGSLGEQVRACQASVAQVSSQLQSLSDLLHWSGEEPVRLRGLAVTLQNLAYDLELVEKQMDSIHGS